MSKQADRLRQWEYERMEDIKTLQRELKSNVTIYDNGTTPGHDGDCENVIVFVSNYKLGRKFLFTMGQDAWSYDFVRTSPIIDVSNMKPFQNHIEIKNYVNDDRIKKTFNNSLLEEFEEEIKDIKLNISFSDFCTIEDLVSVIPH